MKNNTVIFGADYYPEQWPSELWESDADRMKDMGITAVRLMEFAWTIIEPRKGRYDFSLFENVIELFASRGIRTVLGTPTATVPVWLYESDKKMFQIYIDGTQRDFGNRRQACYNSPSYKASAMKIVKQCAKRFGSNENVIGWQIDNEIGHEGSDLCICDNCRKAWHAWLKKKYGNPENMNRAWGTVFWSTSYAKFTQVPVPRPQVMSIQNPGLILDYYRFSSDSAVSFSTEQRDILKKHISPDQWITTDLFSPSMSCVIDFEEMMAPMDLVGMNNYPVWGSQNEPLPYIFTAYNLAYNRGLKDREKFTVFEQICGFQGHTCLGYLPPDGQIRAWTNQAVIHGANSIYYFRWRTASFGQEQLCHGILDTDNRINSRYKELQANIKDYSEEFNKIASSSLIPEACLLYDKDSIRILRDNHLTTALYNSPVKFMQVGYEAESAKFYAPFSLFNVNCEVKSVQSADLNRYKILTLPLYQMSDPVFVDRLIDWVQDGGTLILGWRAGSRDLENRNVGAVLPGLFEDMAGITVKGYESLNDTTVRVRMGVIPFKGQSWADLISPVTAETVVKYTDRKKHYRGTPAVTRNSFGNGRVYYLGTTPDPAGIFFLYRKIFKDAGIDFSFHGYGLEVLKMLTPDGEKFKVALNHTPRRKLAGFKSIKPWGMRVFD